MKLFTKLRIVGLVIMIVLGILQSGVVPALAQESGYYFPNKQQNSGGWVTNPWDACNETDGSYAVLEILGTDVWEQTFQGGIGIVYGEDWVLDNVSLVLAWYSQIMDGDDHFELYWGVGDSALETPPSVWIHLDSFSDPEGSPVSPAGRIYFLTEGIEGNWSALNNIWVKVHGVEELTPLDVAEFQWDSSMITYEYHLDQGDISDGDGNSDGDRDTNLLIMELIVLVILLFLLYWFMRRVQHRFEREVQ